MNNDTGQIVVENIANETEGLPRVISNGQRALNNAPQDAEPVQVDKDNEKLNDKLNALQLVENPQEFDSTDGLQKPPEIQTGITYEQERDLEEKRRRASPSLNPWLQKLECSKIRWYRLHLTRGTVRMRDRDAYIIEIIYRTDQGDDIDDAAQKFIVENLNDKNIRSNPEIDEKPKVEVVHYYYTVEKATGKTSKMDFLDIDYVLKPIYGGDCFSKQLVRGVWFIEDNNEYYPVDSQVSYRLEEHLNKFQPKTATSTPDRLLLSEKNVVVYWESIDEVIMQTEKIHESGKIGVIEEKKIIRGYPDEPNLDDGHTEVKHLMFLVHGVGHDKKEDRDDILVNAKNLAKGVFKQVKELVSKNQDEPENRITPSQLMILGVHWRQCLEVPSGHKCQPSEVESTFQAARKLLIDIGHKDLRLYDCQQCGHKIRKLVVEKLNALFEKFKFHHNLLDIRISIMGHSLGSVICHDILTNYKTNQEAEDLNLIFPVYQLFVVGSPLKTFLKMRGKTFISRFRETLKNMKILNVYDKFDPVARRLETLIHEMFVNVPAVEIPNENPIADRCEVLDPSVKAKLKRLWTYLTERSGQTLTEEMKKELLEFVKIDHELLWEKGTFNLDRHSIYWLHGKFHLYLASHTILEELGERLLPVNTGDPTVLDGTEIISAEDVETNNAIIDVFMDSMISKDAETLDDTVEIDVIGCGSELQRIE